MCFLFEQVAATKYQGWSAAYAAAYYSSKSGFGILNIVRNEVTLLRLQIFFLKWYVLSKGKLFSHNILSVRLI